MLKVKASETGWSESEWNPANFEEVVLQYQPRIYSFIYRLNESRNQKDEDNPDIG